MAKVLVVDDSPVDRQLVTGLITERGIIAASRGALAPGMVADLVVTDENLALRRVMRAGRWLE